MNFTEAQVDSIGYYADFIDQACPKKDYPKGKSAGAASARVLL